jgi:DNA-binding Lrp family transcriptional regulator
LAARLLAFVNIFVESSLMDDVVASLIKLDNLEELYEVTGEFDVVTLLSATDIEEFRDVLKNKIMKIQGVKSTVSSVVLQAYKGPRCAEQQQQQQQPQSARVIEPQKAKPTRQ